MACHGVISAGFGRNRFCIKLEITPPSNSYHFRYRTVSPALMTKEPSATQIERAPNRRFDKALVESLIRGPLPSKKAIMAIVAPI